MYIIWTEVLKLNSYRSCNKNCDQNTELKLKSKTVAKAKIEVEVFEVWAINGGQN